MRILLTLILLVLFPPPDPARADGEHYESEGLELLLEARRDGTILPLSEILQSVNAITGDKIVEIEFEEEDGRVKYGIYYLTPNGLRREIYVDAQTGEILEEKADD